MVSKKADVKNELYEKLGEFLEEGLTIEIYCNLLSKPFKGEIVEITGETVELNIGKNKNVLILFSKIVAVTFDEE